MTSVFFAKLAAGAATLVLVLFAVLHVIKPELDPTWRMMSEYSNGTFGWIMVSAFVVWALSCVALLVAIRPHIKTIVGKIGLGFLAITALGLLLSAIFPIDPLTQAPDQATFNGKMHGITGALCINGFAVAALLINWGLLRNKAWAQWRLLVAILGIAPLLSLIWLMSTMTIALGNNGGQYGAEVQIGIPNRVMVVTYTVWILTTALLALRMKNKNT